MPMFKVFSLVSQARVLLHSVSSMGTLDVAVDHILRCVNPITSARES